MHDRRGNGQTVCPIEEQPRVDEMARPSLFDRVGKIRLELDRAGVCRIRLTKARATP